MSQKIHSGLSIFKTLNVTTSETTLDLIGFKSAGYLRTIIVRKISGGGASFALNIFDQLSSATASTHLIYTGTGLSYDTAITVNRIFYTLGANTDADLGLTLTPASNGVIEVRLDFEIIQS